MFSRSSRYTLLMTEHGGGMREVPLPRLQTDEGPVCIPITPEALMRAVTTESYKARLEHIAQKIGKDVRPCDVLEAILKMDQQSRDRLYSYLAYIVPVFGKTLKTYIRLRDVLLQLKNGPRQTSVVKRSELAALLGVTTNAVSVYISHPLYSDLIKRLGFTFEAVKPNKEATVQAQPAQSEIESPAQKHRVQLPRFDEKKAANLLAEKIGEMLRAISPLSNRKLKYRDIANEFMVTSREGQLVHASEEYIKALLPRLARVNPVLWGYQKKISK